MTTVVVADSQPGSGRSKRRARWSLIVIAALFAVPLGAAVWLFNSGWRPGSTVNHGELIQPPIDVSGLALRDMSGRQLERTPVTGRWTLVIVAGSSCAERCQRQLYDTRQVRLAVGKDIDRVQRLLLADGQGPQPAGIDALHPDLRILQLPPAGDLDQPGSILLIDPLGNLMMRYSGDYQSGGMLKDLQRLLKWSEIG